MSEHPALAALEVLVHLDPTAALPLNPLHGNSASASIVGKEPFAFDERLLRGGV